MRNVVMLLFMVALGGWLFSLGLERAEQRAEQRMIEIEREQTVANTVVRKRVFHVYEPDKKNMDNFLFREYKGESFQFYDRGQWVEHGLMPRAYTWWGWEDGAGWVTLSYIETVEYGYNARGERISRTPIYFSK